MGHGDLRVKHGLVIPQNELVETFSRSGGPGGQHANKVSTRVEIRFDIAESTVLTEYQRERLTEAFGGEMRVVVDEERSQLRNRTIARERLAGRIRNALVPNKTRRPTRRTRGSQIRRLDAKKRRGQLKSQRRYRGDE